MKFKRGELVYVKSLPAGRESIRNMHGPAFIENVIPSAGFYGLLFVGDDAFVYQAKEEHLRSIRKNERRVVEFIRYLKPSKRS